MCRCDPAALRVRIVSATGASSLAVALSVAHTLPGAKLAPSAASSETIRLTGQPERELGHHQPGNKP